MTWELGLWKAVARRADWDVLLTDARAALAAELGLSSLGVLRINVLRAAAEWVGPAPSGIAPRSALARDELERLATACLRAAPLEPALARTVIRGAGAAHALVPVVAGEGLALVYAGFRGEAETRRFVADPAAVAALADALGTALRHHLSARAVPRVPADGSAEPRAVVGADSTLRPVLERVELVARTDLPVLLLGETGTGKEVISREIHERSRRAAGPFLRVNCGAISPQLIDSELFGHEKGSFTGATGVHRGWFERADGGTLFLDEIGEMPEAAQVRLLRVLQDGRFERVGGQATVQVDVRVVAATHRDLEAMAAEGRFRRDLLYRIAAFPVHIPALRDRTQDLEALTVHFVRKAAARFGMAAPTVEPTHVAHLARYAWPGNIRELCTVIERALLLGGGADLPIAAALGEFAPRLPGSPAPARAPAPATPDLAPARDGSMDGVVRRHIEDALAAAQGRIEGPFGAARALGVNPHTLRSRMKRLGIEWKAYRVRASG